MKEGTDFTFVEKLESDFYSIKILTGEWKDVIFTFGAVSIREANDEAILSYDFRIEETPSFTEDELLESDAFRNKLGDILVTILENSEAQIGKAPHGAEPTNNNP